MNTPMIHLSLKKQNNQIWKTTKLYDPLLLKSLQSFRELIVGEFYREISGLPNEKELVLVVKVKMEDGKYHDLKDELDWSQIVQEIVKTGQILQFQAKCKLAKKVSKKQLKEIDQKLKELELERQLLLLRKQLIELSLEKSEEKPQEPRDKLLESIRNGKKLKKTPKTTKVETDPREILLNSIRNHSESSQN